MDISDLFEPDVGKVMGSLESVQGDSEGMSLEEMVIGCQDLVR